MPQQKARVTSSRDRSKGSAKKPVTTSKGRPNRQKVSQAKPTTGGQRSGTSAQVTTGRGGQRPRGTAPVTGTQRPALPPGKPGGALTRQTNQKGGALTTRQPSGALTSTRVPAKDIIAEQAKKNTERAKDALQNRGGTRAPGKPSPGPADLVRTAGRLRGAGAALGAFTTAAAIPAQVAAIAEKMPRTVNAVRQLGEMATGQRDWRSGIKYGESQGLTKEQQQRNRQAELNRSLERQSRAIEQTAGPVRAGGGGGRTPAPRTGGGGRVPSSAGAAPRSSGGGGGGAAPRPAAMPSSVAAKMDSSMDEKYATWARTWGKLASKVKKGQAGYEAIQRVINPAKAEPEKPITPSTQTPSRQISPLSDEEKGAYNSPDMPFGGNLKRDPQWLKDFKKRQQAKSMS